jgi:hypothetical protein
MKKRYAYHKPFTVKFPDKCEWRNKFRPDINYMDGSKTNKGTGAGGYCWGSRRGHNFSLGLQTTLFQAKVWLLNLCNGEYIQRRATPVQTATFFLSVKWPLRALTVSR